MTQTAVAPPQIEQQDEAPQELADTCPVCQAPEAQVALYVSTRSLDYIRRVWRCLSCRHEWPRQPEDTAK